MLVTCPSGLKFQARPWNLGDQNFLTDTAIIEAGLLPRRMVEVATIELVDAGPYAFQSVINWGEVSLADITAANIQIRKASDDESLYKFDFPCAHCGKMKHAQI